ncbi:S-formylglutathione hydrolase FrmB [Amycolatopsis sacchari]|uniref:S-formylglutathione hydrolase FrmB n=1 Tax=Amycolatopsis sacchari TaxID=115433 RepID=A0A1I4B6C5_9PSEU|nr:alpha/beta hydrolase-fold protein [Amycolatopsis sacchari]SFK64472.1 S-formylglutathione hydrolase FrmB [Amycolatopsis sacchari]
MSALSGWWPVLAAGLLAVTAWLVRRRGTRLVLASVAVVLLAASGFVAVSGNRPAGEAQRPHAGVFTTVAIPSPGFAARPAVVYLPPVWFTVPRPSLPVLLLLHGTPGAPEDWLTSGDAAATLETWAAAHGGRAPVVVMPDINGNRDGDSECVGPAEDYLTTTVPSFVHSRYGTQPPGAHWAVAGLSEGGSCALQLTLGHPGVFATFGDYSGLAGPRTGDRNAPGDTVPKLFAGSTAAFDRHEPRWLLTHRRYPGTAGWFEVGDQDADPLAAARQLEPLARSAGVATRLTVVPGGRHDFPLWRQAFADSLPWLEERLSS